MTVERAYNARRTTRFAFLLTVGIAEWMYWFVRFVASHGFVPRLVSRLYFQALLQHAPPWELREDKPPRTPRDAEVSPSTDHVFTVPLDHSRCGRKTVVCPLFLPISRIVTLSSRDLGALGVLGGEIMGQ